MDITNIKLLQAHQPLFPSNMEKKTEMEPRNSNPFEESFPDDDPLCRINLKETADFIKSLPISSNNNNNDIRNERRESVSAQKSTGSSGQRRVLLMESPCTPGRPVFSFNNASGRRRNFPSKWADAEKWVLAGHDSPVHPFKNSISNTHFDGLKHQVDGVFSEKSRVTEEKVARTVSALHGSLSLDHHCISGAKALNGSVSSSPSDILKDKFTDEVQQILPKHKSSDTSTEGFLFRNSTNHHHHETKHRDIGTEMTPNGSSTTSTCHTPFKSTSPARHNTPSKLSGPLTLTGAPKAGIIDISEFTDKLHLAETVMATAAQYDSVTTNWSSREEEEEEISKSLRHFDVGSEFRRSLSESKADHNAWEEEEKLKYCQRYQREEAKIEAWVNLQSAKAEAQSRKLEVKIQKMRSNMEEKLMKRMAAVHRRAEERKATARQQHVEQMQKASEHSRKLMLRRGPAVSGRASCGCFPCNHNSYD